MRARTSARPCPARGRAACEAAAAPVKIAGDFRVRACGRDDCAAAEKPPAEKRILCGPRFPPGAPGSGAFSALLFLPFFPGVTQSRRLCMRRWKLLAPLPSWSAVKNWRAHGGLIVAGPDFVIFVHLPRWIERIYYGINIGLRLNSRALRASDPRLFSRRNGGARN